MHVYYIQNIIVLYGLREKHLLSEINYRNHAKY
jgi:hypothetical protein